MMLVEFGYDATNLQLQKPATKIHGGEKEVHQRLQNMKTAYQDEDFKPLEARRVYQQRMPAQYFTYQPITIAQHRMW